jgi:hypothetical protein
LSNGCALRKEGVGTVSTRDSYRGISARPSQCTGGVWVAGLAVALLLEICYNGLRSLQGGRWSSRILGLLVVLFVSILPPVHFHPQDFTITMEKSGADVESGRGPNGISHWKMLIDQGVVTPEMQSYHYEGSGTEEDPYVVVWMVHDLRNPMRWAPIKKWSSCLVMALATLAVSFCSSAFSGGTCGSKLRPTRSS